MTLILGTVANGTTPHVVISADGLSLALRGKKEFVASGTTQKVWLFPGAKAAVAHFGQNTFWDSGARCWHGITDDLRQASEDASLGLKDDLSTNLVETFNERVASTLAQRDSASRFALWVAGIDRSGQAVIEELCWERATDGTVPPPLRKSFGEAGKGEVAAAGDGHEVIGFLLSERIDGQYYPERLADEGVEYALEYHRRFILAALLEQSRQRKTIFGGKFETVVISENDCRAVPLDL